MLILSSYLSFGQRGNEVWIPKKYIDKIREKNITKELDYLLKPIESILYENKVYYIQTYRGLSLPIVDKRKNSRRIAIDHLSFNLKYFTKKEQDSINQYKFFLNTYKDSIILEVQKGAVINHIKFNKEFGGYKFEHLPITTSKLLLAGSYELLGCNDLDHPININLFVDGTVSGTTIYKTYQVEKVFVPDDKNTFYDLLIFSRKDESTRKLAFYYDEQQLCWLAYDYKIATDKYTIIVSEKCVFKLIKND